MMLGAVDAAAESATSTSSQESTRAVIGDSGGEAKMKKSSQYEEARKMEQAMTSDRGFIS